MIQGNAAQPKVSIVVPVYNSKQYLARCLDSLLGQTVSEIEVVLVDDGSTDGSSLTCDGWADIDSRIRVIHKENGGLSDARNCGALAARAPYIAFIDSDDSVDLDFCESLLRDIEATGADIATCDVVDVEDGCELPDHIDASHRTVEVVTPVGALRASITSGLPRIWVPTRLYKKELFDNGFLFPVGKTYEDAATIVEIFGSASSISVSTPSSIIIAIVRGALPRNLTLQRRMILLMRGSTPRQWRAKCIRSSKKTWTFAFIGRDASFLTE